MGLEITFYDKNNNIIKRKEFRETIHSSIFQESNNWSSYLYLCKLRDYYKTDITYCLGEVDELINELSQIRIFIKREDILKEFDELINDFKSNNIYKVHFGGD